MNNIGDLIDLEILDYINHINKVSFSEANVTVKMLEMELGRVQLRREQLYEGMEALIDDPVEHDALSREFIQTYIAEHKINDRIGITKRYSEIKGVH